MFWRLTLSPLNEVDECKGSSSSLSLVGFDCLLSSILLELGYERVPRDRLWTKSGRIVGREAETTESEPSTRLQIKTGEV